VDGDSPVQLIGRGQDVAFVRGFVDDAAVQGGALLVSGDAGVGKTALLDVAALDAETAGTRVVRAVGAEFEAELGFSGLNVVLHPFLDGLATLPPLHRQALGVALGLDAGPSSDRLVVSNAVLALLRDAAATRPLLVIVDDLQWLDRASSLVLASAVRRLAGTGVGFLAAMRPESQSFFDRAGLPSYGLKPLDRAAATSLLKRRFPALTPSVRERLIADAQGNPLALLELPIALRDARPARGHLADALPLTARLQALFASRTVLGRLEEAIAGLNRESSPTRIARFAVASAYIDRLPQCRPALWRVVHDGRAGGAVTMSIHALALLGFDY
jgi:hypothetical protein